MLPSTFGPTDMETPSAIREIMTFLATARPSATVAFRRLARSALTAAGDLDALARSLGFRALGDRWLEIERPAAAQLIARALETNLAYDWSGEMEADHAGRIATAFLDCFPLAASPRCFTNGAFISHGWSGHKVAPATSETGVGVVSDDAVGLLWVEDED
jgi:hypothetical protein